ncbi:hypothetical protein ACQUI6_002943 [Enterococcus faecalis]|nr:hypothetical protein [Enterococcus faecalis]EKN1541982.1 hypothetical protein [Enterococcus faecalis]
MKQLSKFQEQKTKNNNSGDWGNPKNLMNVRLWFFRGRSLKLCNMGTCYYARKKKAYPKMEVD